MTGTHIAPSASLTERALGGSYSEDAIASGVDHHKGVQIFASRHQSPQNSQFLSLQLKAWLAGIPTPVYGLAPVHHTY